MLTVTTTSHGARGQLRTASGRLGSISSRCQPRGGVLSVTLSKYTGYRIFRWTAFRRYNDLVQATGTRARSSNTDAEALTEVVNRLRRVLRAGIRTDYAWETLPMAQIELLQCLRDHEPAGIRVGEICAQLHLAPATTSGLVQQLVEAGTAKRQPDPADRRAAVVRLTNAGRKQLNGWQRAHERRLGNALSQLSVSQRAAVRAAVPALAALVDKLSQS
jgi:DNA-binding MarR family transcriptional regulator